MNSPLRASRMRLLLGLLGALAGFGVALFLLPDASQQLAQKLKAKQEAELSRNQQVQRLTELQQLADRIRRGRETLADLEARLPRGSAGELQWSLSKTLHALPFQRNERLLLTTFWVYRRIACEPRRDLDHRLVDQNRHRIQVAGVAFEPEPLRLER